MLSWVHFGDLHVSDEDDWASLGDLGALVSETNRSLAKDIDFVFLPSDNANHGTPEQYRRIHDALVGAGLSGVLGWKFGFGAIFWLAAIFGLVSVAAALMIPARAIDHRAARGLEVTGQARARC